MELITKKQLWARHWRMQEFSQAYATACQQPGKPWERHEAERKKTPPHNIRLPFSLSSWSRQHATVTLTSQPATPQEGFQQMSIMKNELTWNVNPEFKHFQRNATHSDGNSQVFINVLMNWWLIQGPVRLMHARTLMRTRSTYWKFYFF